MGALTMKQLGDWMVFAPGALPASFVQGRPGALIPSARKTAMESIDAAAAAAIPVEAKWPQGMVLPDTPPPHTYMMPGQPTPNPYWGAAPPGCCPAEPTLVSPFEVYATDLDMSGPLERFIVGDNVPGASPTIQREDVAIGGAPVNTITMKTPGVPVGAALSPLQRQPLDQVLLSNARQLRLQQLSKPVALAERASLLPTGASPELAQAASLRLAGLGQFRGFGALGSSGPSDETKKNLTKLVGDAELTWAQYQAGQRSLPAAFRSGLDYLRTTLTTSGWEASWTPVVLGGYPSSSALLARVNNLHRLVIAGGTREDGTRTIASSAINRDGSAKQQSPIGAAAASLRRDAEEAARRAAAGSPPTSLLKTLAVGAAIVVGGSMAISWAHGRGGRR